MTRLLTTASSDFEAEIIRDRLAEAGVDLLIQGEGNPRAVAGGPRDIFVEDDDLQRAQEALQEAQNVDDEELTALAERDPQEQSGGG